MPEQFYKVLTAAGCPNFQDGDAYPPIGEWTPTVDNPMICKRGWHLTTQPHKFIQHIDDLLFVAEGRGKYAASPDKTAYASVRLLRQIRGPIHKSVIAIAREKNPDHPDLREANLRGAVLTGADLRGVVLTEADLHGAELREAYLGLADLTGAKLRLADLTGADLRWTDLRGADLTGADLRGAQLRGAKLRDAILTCAVLTGADLRGAELHGAIGLSGYNNDHA